jgi:agmatine deiminase
MPAEWAPQRAVWSAWPAAADLWEDDLAEAQAEFLALARAIALPRASGANGERAPRLELLYPIGDTVARSRLEDELGSFDLGCHEAAYGDIWLRDTGPTFLLDSNGQLASLRFRFNGWGQRYLFPPDLEVGGRVEELASVATRLRCRSALCAEGGAIESDGRGTLMSTTSVLLNANRGNGEDRGQVETELKRTTGARHVVWSSAALLADHTDGHIDTLARFACDGSVLHPKPRDHNDPNTEVFVQLERDLRQAVNVEGDALELIEIPSAGTIEHGEQGLVAASYTNFVISNGVVVVPAYGGRYDDQACLAIGQAFPCHEIRQAPSRALISGGGSFHCITQQEPLAGSSASLRLQTLRG